MALTEIAGVFSRYFIVGFYAPAFFALFLVSRLLDPSALPSDYNHASGGAQVLVVGGSALLLALLLSGIHYSVLRLFEGYPFTQLRDFAEKTDATVKRELPYRTARHLGAGLDDGYLAVRALLARFASTLYDALMSGSRRRFGVLDARRIPGGGDDSTRAANKIAKFYPDIEDQLLPTRFGNAIRSFERHPRERYGFTGVATWARIEMLLSDTERELVSKGETDVAFFVNATVLLCLMGLAFIADAAANGGLSPALWFLYALPFVAAYASYRAAVPAAGRWGDSVRAGFDLHRLELYRRLGVKQPMGPEEEKQTARLVNRMLLFGEPLDAELRIEEDGPDE